MIRSAGAHGRIEPVSPGVIAGAAQAEAVVGPRWLGFIRVAWAICAALALGVIALSVPAYISQLGAITLTEAKAGELANFPITLPPGYEFAADLAYMIVALTASALCVFLALIVFLRRADRGIAVFVSFLLLAFGSIMTGPLQTVLEAYQPRWFTLAFVGQEFLWTLGVVPLFYIFPDGVFDPPWTRWLAALLLPWTASIQVIPGLYPSLLNVPDASTALLQIAWFGLPSLTAVYALVRRCQRLTSQVKRQQVKWALCGFAGWVVSGTLVPAFLLVTISHLSAPAMPHPTLASLVIIVLGRLAWPLGLAFFPLSLSIAVLRYRLWDIDLIFNRALVYASLTALVVGIYAFVVGVAGALLQSRGAFFISLAAAGLIAVIFHPLRERIQRAVNQLMYGDRDDPYKALARLGQRLEATLVPDSVLPTIAETIASALKLPYAAIALNSADGGATTATYGELKGDSTRLALNYQGESVGELLLSPRAPGEPFSLADRRLLDDLAHQAGVAVYAVRITTDLQRSRERLVTTREEERRRLRRELHDGLGPVLASMSFRLDALQNLIESDPGAARAQAAALKAQIQASLDDIRRIAYDLRPPALDELGLVGALREQVLAHNQRSGVRFTLAAPASAIHLPAAIEVAIYRIALEGMLNTVRHAHARRCQVRLTITDGVSLEILDDGAGLSPDRRSGVGMAAMRERAEELGGTCEIAARPEGGTRVCARLPLPANEATPPTGES